MDPNFYSAYIVSQTHPDNPYRFGPPPGISPSNTTISPYDNPYTATTRPVANPSIEAISCPKSSPLATGEVTSPSIATFIRSSAPSPTTPPADTTPSIAPNAGTVTPALTNGSGSIPSSSSHSPARSPSPDAEALIASLTNHESLGDEALYTTTLAAQQALVKWQNEYMALETSISRMEDSPYSTKTPKANPRKVANPETYDRKHHAILHQPTPPFFQSRGRFPRPAPFPYPPNPFTDEPEPPKGRKPRNELHIDMTAPMQPVQGKRIRKPRVLDTEAAAVTAPRKSTKRAREHDNDANTNTNTNNTPALDQAPPSKKQKQETQHIRDITPPAWVRTAATTTATTTAIKAESKEPSAVPEKVSKKRDGAGKGIKKTATATEKKLKQEPKDHQKSAKDPVRAAAAKLMWAKRKASGTNGRYGGKPTERTVAKAKAKAEMKVKAEGGL